MKVWRKQTSHYICTRFDNGACSFGGFRVQWFDTEGVLKKALKKVKNLVE